MMEHKTEAERLLFSLYETHTMRTKPSDYLLHEIEKFFSTDGCQVVVTLEDKDPAQ